MKNRYFSSNFGVIFWIFFSKFKLVFAGSALFTITCCNLLLFWFRGLFTPPCYLISKKPRLVRVKYFPCSLSFDKKLIYILKHLPIRALRWLSRNTNTSKFHWTETMCIFDIKSVYLLHLISSSV